MEFYQWQPGDALQTNRFGIQEPIPLPARKLIADAQTVILLPALAATRTGIRLGHGGGYYDRYCAQYPLAQRYAVLFDQFVMTDLPEEPHDLRMHGLITERETVICLQ
jgi:5-formyltetrahydrofolate cyclo-ligase